MSSAPSPGRGSPGRGEREPDGGSRFPNGPMGGQPGPLMWPGWSTVVGRPPGLGLSGQELGDGRFRVPYSPNGGDVSSSRIGCLTLARTARWSRSGEVAGASAQRLDQRDRRVAREADHVDDDLGLERGDPFPERPGRILGGRSTEICSTADHASSSTYGVLVPRVRLTTSCPARTSRGTRKPADVSAPADHHDAMVQTLATPAGIDPWCGRGDGGAGDPPEASQRLTDARLRDVSPIDAGILVAAGIVAGTIGPGVASPRWRRIRRCWRSGYLRCRRTWPTWSRYRDGPGSALSSRRELAQSRTVLVRLLPAVALGTAIGAGLLLVTPAPVFARLVPFLVAAGSVALIVQPALLRVHARRSERGALDLLLVAAVSIYGGYFGAGSGIMLLAVTLVVVDPRFPVADAIKNVPARSHLNRGLRHLRSDGTSPLGRGRSARRRPLDRQRPRPDHRPASAAQPGALDCRSVRTGLGRLSLAPPGVVRAGLAKSRPMCVVSWRKITF